MTESHQAFFQTFLFFAASMNLDRCHLTMDSSASPMNSLIRTASGAVPTAHTHLLLHWQTN